MLWSYNAWVMEAKQGKSKRLLIQAVKINSRKGLNEAYMPKVFPLMKSQCVIYGVQLSWLTSWTTNNSSFSKNHFHKIKIHCLLSSSFQFSISWCCKGFNEGKIFVIPSHVKWNWSLSSWRSLTWLLEP